MEERHRQDPRRPRAAFSLLNECTNSTQEEMTDRDFEEGLRGVLGKKFQDLTEEPENSGPDWDGIWERLRGLLIYGGLLCGLWYLWKTHQMAEEPCILSMVVCGFLLGKAAGGR